MTFRYDWFTGEARTNFERFLIKYKGFDRLKFLEIGSFEGMSTTWLLQNILINDDCKIVCIDTFQGSDEHKKMGIDLTNLYEIFKNNIEPYKEKVVTLIGKSQDILMKDSMANEEFDFIYIDGSHRSPDVIQDAILSFRLLKKGGILIFDDYGGGPCDDDIESPKLAIDSFMTIFRKEIKILFKGWQVVIEK